MKCLSLTQPYATLMALGLKRIETRSWRTFYRGPLYIHAAKNFPTWARALCLGEPFRGALEAAGIFRLSDLPCGSIIATVDLLDCCEIGTDGVATHGYWTLRKGWVWVWVGGKEFAFGDYTKGRWAWLTTNNRPLPEPIPYRGQLGLFEVELPCSPSATG